MSKQKVRIIKSDTPFKDGIPHQWLWVESDTADWVDGYSEQNHALMIGPKTLFAIQCLLGAHEAPLGIPECRVMSLSAAMDLQHLSDYIMSMEGEPSQPGGTAACALRLLKRYAENQKNL